MSELSLKTPFFFFPAMSEAVSENEINRMFWGVKEERKCSAFKLNLPSFFFFFPYKLLDAAVKLIPSM